MFTESEVFTSLMLSILFFWDVTFCMGWFNIPSRFEGLRGGAVGWDTALQAGRSRVRLWMVFIDLILPAAVWPWGRLRLQQKWVPGIFRKCKGGRNIGLKTLPTSCAECLKILVLQTPGTRKPYLLHVPNVWKSWYLKLQEPENLTYFMCRMSENLGTSNSRNP